MKPRISPIIFFLFAISVDVCFSQQVISSAGTTVTSTTAQLSWTVGEPVIETFIGPGAILTQGFHQTRYTVTVIDPVTIPGIILSVYPNPVTDDLNLDLKGERTERFRYRLYDLNGKLIISGKPEKQPETVEMTGFPVGTYLLKVTGFNGFSQSFKIVKTDF